MLTSEQIKKELYSSLKELDLTEHEISLYSLSLSLGPTSIANLSKYMNIPRPNVYKVIEGLEEAGLAKFSEVKGYAKTFMVEEPSIILELIRKKNEKLLELDKNITGIMPDLLASYHQGELPTSIKIIKGKEQFLKAYNQALEESKDATEFFGSVQDFLSFISWQRELEWIRHRIKKGVKAKILVLPSKTTNIYATKDNEEFRETRVLKVKDPFNCCFQLFANKVIIWQPKAPLAVLISDQYIVQMLRSIFYTLWESSK